jgi:hypothetical protein
MAVAVQERQSVFEAPPSVSRDELEQVLAFLEQRLRRGGEMIRERRAAGEDTATLQRYWDEMLRSYERLAAYLADQPN